MKKLKDILLEADVFGADDKKETDGAADVSKLITKMTTNQAFKSAIEKINMKNEVAPAIIAFAQMLNDQVPGALNASRRQSIIKALKGME